MRKISFLITILFVLTTNFCFAANDLELDYPSFSGITLTTQTTLPGLVKYIFTLAIGISGLLAFGVLIYSGTQWLTSAGNPARINDSKDRIFAAFLGLIILLCAYVILTTINPDLINIQMPNI